MQIGVVTLGVADMARARRYYERFLQTAPETDSSGVCYFALPAGSWLALYPRDALADYAGVASAGHGFAGVTLSVNLASAQRVDDAVQRAERAGARLSRPAGPAAWGGYIAWVQDPDGFLWELVWNPRRAP